MKIIDLTHAFTSDMPSYPGDPKATLEQTATVTTDGYTDHKLVTHMHVGTHMDAPLHMIENGMKMSQIAPDQFLGPGVLIDARGKTVIDASIVANTKIPPGSIVLVYTGFGAKYHSPEYFESYPRIDTSFAKKMVEAKVKIVGMDILGPDDPPFETHKILLGANVLIIENLTNLEALAGVDKFDVIALPTKLETDGAPVRVIVKIL